MCVRACVRACVCVHACIYPESPATCVPYKGKLVLSHTLYVHVLYVCHHHMIFGVYMYPCCIMSVGMPAVW